MKRILTTIWDTWLEFGQIMGEIVGRVVLSIFYLTIVLPFGIGVRLFSDPLDVKNKKPNWVERESPEPTVEVASQQF